MTATSKWSSRLRFMATAWATLGQTASGEPRTVGRNVYAAASDDCHILQRKARTIQSEVKARPHPDPLPQEREPAMAALRKSLNGEPSPTLENLLPLPGGEGRGEGEHE